MSHIGNLADQLRLRVIQDQLGPILKWRSLDDAISSTNNNFNVTRLILAAFVIYFHGFGMIAGNTVSDPIQRTFFPVGADIGATAVDMFFLISGLFVAQSYFRDRNLAAFAVKRILRIYPGLLVCVALTACISVLLEQPQSILDYLTYPGFWTYITNNAVLDLTWTLPGVFESHANSAINGPLHTLPREVAMYFCLAFSLGFFGKRFIAFGFGVLVFLAMAFFFPTISDWLRIPERAYIQALCFFAGVILFSLAPWVKLNGVMVLALVLIHPLVPDAFAHLTFLITLSAALLWFSSLPKLPFFKGDYSYGVYIYGWPAQQFLISLWPIWNPFIHFLAAFVMALGFAIVSWRRIEEPAIAFGKSLSRLAKSGSIPAIKSYDWLGSVGARTVYALLALFIGFHIAGGVTRHLIGPDVGPLELGAVRYDSQQIIVGQAFNPQPNGQSGLWVAYETPPPPGSRVVFDGHRLNTIIGPEVATTLVPTRLISTPGVKNIYLEYRTPSEWLKSEQWQVVVALPPLPLPRPSANGAEEMAAMPLGRMSFGPETAQIGVSFNRQPDGSSAIWVSYERKPPEGAQIVFEGEPLATLIGSDVATAKIPERLLSTPGQKTLYLEYRTDTHWLRSETMTLELNDS